MGHPHAVHANSMQNGGFWIHSHHGCCCGFPMSQVSLILAQTVLTMESDHAASTGALEKKVGWHAVSCLTWSVAGIMCGIMQR